MAIVRHIFVCEGTSEQTYIQRLQSFIEKLPTRDGTAFPTLIFVAPNRTHIANGGQYQALKRTYGNVRKRNPRSQITVWTDFDLYHRDDGGCAIAYAGKGHAMPDFHFSFHNFEDFISLHFDGDLFEEWYRWGQEGHFGNPQPSEAGRVLINKLIPDYQKGTLPADFINKRRLMNLRTNLSRQPRSNPHGLQGVKSFAEFVIQELHRHHPEIFTEE